VFRARGGKLVERSVQRYAIALEIVEVRLLKVNGGEFGFEELFAELDPRGAVWEGIETRVRVWLASVRGLTV
jgi:hypothetical protein